MKTLLLCVAVIFAMSCQKDISTEIPEINTPKLPAAPITGSVAGSVVDENNDPVAGALVNIGTSVYITDANGIFRTPSITLDKYISTVKVTVAGYFTAYRSFSANPVRNYVTVKMIPKVLTGSFNSTAIGSVVLPNGSSINFQANGVKDKLTGAPYTGTVNVYAAYIDPTNSDFGTTIPGSMMGEDAQSSYTLRSTGMMAVELESAAGVPLQLESTKPATMKMEIPATLLGEAPGTINTWSLDARGVWIKEGSAIRVGNYYEFQVSHFSFWNCDVPTQSIFLTINVKDQNGNIMANRWVSLTSTTNFGTTWGHTDSLGNVSGMVPKDEVLGMEVFHHTFQCNGAIHSQNVGPFAANSSLNVVVTLTPASTWVVNGTVYNCAGNPIDSGFVLIYTGAYQVSAYVTNGIFSQTITNCVPITSIQLTAVDIVSGQQGSTVTVPVTGNTINAGTITACGIALNEFITYTIDGTTTHSITSANPATSYLNATTTGTATHLLGYNQATGESIRFGVSGTSIGMFPVMTDSIFINNYVGVSGGATSSTTFTSYGAVGEFVEGTFDIPFTGSGAFHNMTGSFRIRRN